MKKMKKIISMVLCCCMMFGLMSTSAYAIGKEDEAIKEQVVAQGTCGTATNLKGEMVANVWQLTSKGILTITGAFNANKQPILMPAYDETTNQAPWADYRSSIEVVIIDGVLANISDYAFADCTALRKVTLTENIINIGEGAFTGCNTLTTVEIPASVETIESKAFTGCSSLEKVTIYGETTEFTVDTFNTDVNQLDFYVYMGSWADEYLYNENLYDVYFLDDTVSPTPTEEPGVTDTPTPTEEPGVTDTPTPTEEPGVTDTPTPTEEPGTDKVIARGLCGSTRPVNGNTYGNIWTLTADGVLTIVGNYDAVRNPIAMPAYSADASNPAPWREYADQITEVVIEGVLPNISEGAFANCTYLTKVSISESVSAIGTEAFYGCSNLSNVTIPATVETIAGDAFSYCAGLEKVYILGKETQIGRDAFYGSNDLTIYGYIGSEADAYAAQYNIPFVSLDETPINPTPTEEPGVTDTPNPTGTPGTKEDVTDVFSDVYNDWYTNYVQYVYDNELMTGIKGTTKFEPNSNITKAQVAQVLYNMESQPAVSDQKVFKELKDVYDYEWYANAVAWAYNNNIVTGDLNSKKFSPNADVTREQLALMMFRYAKFKNYDMTATSDFAGLANAHKVSDWSMDGMKWAVGKGLISGAVKNGVKDLDPQGNASRAQVAAILQRFCDAYK